MKPYAEIDGITIYHASLEDVLESLPRVDAIIADPPTEETSLEWDKWPAYWPVQMAKLSNSMWCFGSLKLFLQRASEFTRWKPSQDIVWKKQNSTNFRTDRFRRIHEQAVHWWQGPWEEIHKEPQCIQTYGVRKSIPRRGKTPHLNSIEGSAYVDDGTRYMTSVINVRNCHGRADNETEKPEGIIAPLVAYSVPEGGIVLDPFAGSGVTGIVARRQRKRAILIDMRECQCEAAARRLQQQELSLGGQ